MRCFIILLILIPEFILSSEITLKIRNTKISIVSSSNEIPSEKFDLNSHNLIKSSLYIQSLLEKNKKTLIYSHCLFGNAPVFQDYANHLIRKIVGPNYNLLILDWGELDLSYTSNRTNAQNKGKLIGEILNNLDSAIQISFISHSMGSELMRNSLFECKSKKINHWIMFAPDLVESEFIQDEEMISDLVDTIIIYNSNSDIILKLAKLIDRKPRLRNLKCNYKRNIKFVKTNFRYGIGLHHTKWLSSFKMRRECKEALLIIL